MYIKVSKKVIVFVFWGRATLCEDDGALLRRFTTAGSI